MIGKIPIGVPFFDAEFGGVYPHRVILVTGRSGAGKTVLGLQFLDQGLRLQERALMLSARPAQDLVIMAESLGMNVAAAIESGSLTLLEYNEFIPGRDHEVNIDLPPDGFIQLKEIIEQQAVNRVVIDTVLPWITLPNPAQLPEHIFSLLRAFERLGVTTLFTLPKPVSASASHLRKLVEDVVPISLTLLHEPSAPSRKMIISKYLGMDTIPEGFNFEIVPRRGLVLFQAATAPEPPLPLPAAATLAETEPATRPVAPYAAPASGKARVSFASMVLAPPPSQAGAPRPTPASPMRGGTGTGGGS